MEETFEFQGFLHTRAVGPVWGWWPGTMVAAVDRTSVRWRLNYESGENIGNRERNWAESLFPLFSLVPVFVPLLVRCVARVCSLLFSFFRLDRAEIRSTADSSLNIILYSLSVHKNR